MIPSYVAAFCLLGAFGPRGLLQQLLGVERLPEIYGYWGALAALTLSTYPYVLLLVSAALRALDPSLEEAGRGLGQTPFAVFRRVTLPALRPSIGAGALLVALYALSDFGVVSLMRYDALTRAIYLQYRSLFDRTPAAMLGARAHRDHGARAPARERAGGAASRAAGPARRGSSGRTGSAAGAGPRSPIARRSSARFSPCRPRCSATGSRAGSKRSGLPWRRDRSTRSPPRRSRRPSPLLAALPIALLAMRYPTRWTRLLERLSFAGNALPGIVIALSLVFFAANYASPLYQTLALLVFAYVVRFLPQALAGVESSLAAVGPRVEEAARALGRGPLATTLTVTVPLVRSGIFAGAALVFLSAMKELPATLLLRPIGFDTLATEIWKLTSVGRLLAGRPPGAAADRRLGALRLPALLQARARPRSSTARVVRMAGHSVDEYLETIYFLAFPIGEYRPDPNSSAAIASRVAEMLGVSRASAGEMLKRLEADGLVERGEQKEAILTDIGIERAERVVRKHRIIERLLTDFMGYTAGEAHVHADELGDTFSDDMVERIEEKLGHPERCPHGWPIDPAFEQAREQGAGAARRPRGRTRGGDRPARRARRRAPALVLRRGLRPRGTGRDPRSTAGRGAVQGAARRATSGRSARTPPPGSSSVPPS